MAFATRPEVIELVRREWAIAPGTSARQVAERFQAKYGRELVRDRRISEIVTEAKAAAPTEPFLLADWQPWADDAETDEDILFLLRIHTIKKAECGQDLYEHEARWGRQIRMKLEGLEPVYRQYRLVILYGQAEVASYYLNQPVNTEALDDFIAHQPWLKENQRGYEQALAKGAAQLPFNLPVPVTRGNALVDFIQSPFGQFLDQRDPEILLNLLLDPPDPPDRWVKIVIENPEQFSGWSAFLLPSLDPPEIKEAPAKNDPERRRVLAQALARAKEEYPVN
jgi:hypothetical protein